MPTRLGTTAPRWTAGVVEGGTIEPRKRRRQDGVIERRERLRGLSEAPVRKGGETVIRTGERQIKQNATLEKKGDFRKVLLEKDARGRSDNCQNRGNP